jgi:hypothetical protein
MLADGAPLEAVLRRFPEGPIKMRDGQAVRPDRRAIYAHYALLQELQGDPDTDPDDEKAVDRIIKQEGIERAAARTGSALRKYRNLWPNLGWYKSVAPPQWFRDYERLRAGSRS